jgi:renalase
MADVERILIIGAGLAGLIAATELERRGVATVLAEKSRVPGGRMSSRTFGPARFDQGAQHVGARDPRFRERMEQWIAMGVAREWFRTTGAPDEVEPRFVGVGGMRSIPDHLAAGLDLRTGVTVVGVGRSAAGIVAVADDGEIIEADGVILTPPLPQLLALVDAGGLEVPTELRSRLETVRYDACLAVMAELDGPSGLERGHRSAVDGPIAWLGDNQDKGTSTAPAVTIHSSARFAEPRTTFDDRAIALLGDAPVVLAGEVFAGAKVEGAFLSGLAAAERVLTTG